LARESRANNIGFFGQPGQEPNVADTFNSRKVGFQNAESRREAFAKKAGLETLCFKAFFNSTDTGKKTDCVHTTDLR
jgi:hypothetical protein